MAGRVRFAQNSFSKGELSPRLHNRTEIPAYQAGCRICENWAILPQGGVRKRPGTKFVAEVKDSTKDTGLIPFLFNDEQAYVVEVGHLYFRFFRNSGQIVVPNTDAVVTNGAFPTDLTGWTARNSGTGAASAWAAPGEMLLTGPTSGAGRGARYQEILIGAAFRNVTHVLAFRVVAGTTALRIGTAAGGEQIKAVAEYKTGWHTQEFNPAGAVSVFVEFAEEVLNETSRVDDVAMLDNQPVELTTPYTEAEVFEFQTDQSADIMWIAHRNHKPMELRRTGNSSWSVVEYKPVSDPFVSAATFPRAVALWKSRLWWGGTNSDPQKIWGTKVDDFQSLDTGTQLDNEAIVRVIASGKINVVQWMLAGGKQLFVGPFGSEMIVEGDANGLVTPKNVQISPATNHGSGLLRGIQTADSVLFLQRSRRRLRRLAFNWNEDKFQADDLFLEYNHLTSQFAITQLSAADDPDPVVWGIREDGQLLAMIINVPQKILGIGRHTTQGLFKSACTIPHPSGTLDQTWVIVERIVGGNTDQMVEFFEETDGFYGQLHTDSSLTGDFTFAAAKVWQVDASAGPAFVDETTDFNSDAANDCLPFPAAEAIGDYFAVGLGQTFGKLNLTTGIAGVGGVVVWEYWNGTAWVGLVGVVDGTASFSVPGLKHVTYTVPGDWATTALNGSSQFYVRARVTTVFSTNPVLTQGVLATPVDQVGGLGHLEGKTVQIVGDGAAYPEQVVVGGIVNLDPPAEIVEVGLGYDAILDTLRPSLGPQQSINGLTVGVGDLVLHVQSLVTVNVNGVTLPDRSSEMLMDFPPPLFTGDLPVPTIGWGPDEGRVLVEQPLPLPTTVLALSEILQVGDLA
jgi:hypothetical protein